MRFFQKRWVAVLICIVMVLAAIGIRISRNTTASVPDNVTNPGDASSYLQYIYDNGTLSDQTIQTISAYQADMDESYGSICAVALVEPLDGERMKDTAGEIADRMRLRSKDCLLVLNTADEEWYFLYEDEFNYYVNSELKDLVREEMKDPFGDLDRSLLSFYKALEDWYGDYVRNSAGSSDVVYFSEGSISFGALILLLFVVIFVISISSRIRRPRAFRAARPIFFGVPRHRTTFHRPTFHGSGSGPAHRSPPSRPMGHSGSFGSGGRRGGFGGSSGGKRGGFGK